MYIYILSLNIYNQLIQNNTYMLESCIYILDVNCLVNPFGTTGLRLLRRSALQEASQVESNCMQLQVFKR